MNFTELVDEVIAITKRPDLRTRTESAVRSSVLKAHTKDYFTKDIREAGVEFDAMNQVQSFIPKETYPRYRAPAYLRIYNTNSYELSGGSVGNFLNKREIYDFKDSYGYDETDIYYQAGNQLNLRASCQFQRILMGFYQFPVITESGFTSWIAEEYPYAIVFDAARDIFSSIGHTESAQSYAQLTAEQYQILTIENVPAEFK